jgi:hypothetical protein
MRRSQGTKHAVATFYVSLASKIGTRAPEFPDGDRVPPRMILNQNQGVDRSGYTPEVALAAMLTAHKVVDT